MLLKVDKYFVGKKDVVTISIFASSFLLPKLVILSLLIWIGPMVGFHIPVPKPVDESWLFYAIVVAPLIETLLFQHFIIRGLLSIKLIKKYPAISIVVSTIAFSFVHADPSMVALGGGFLGYIYYYFQKYSTVRMAYWSTVFLHAFYNLITYLLVHKYVYLWV